MNSAEVVLSIEELAYAIGILGDVEAASGFLLGTLGQRPRLEVEGRLLAAAHGLIARGYLELDVVTNSSRLKDGLTRMVQPIVDGHYTLRLSRVKDGEEEVATLYVSETGMVLHRLEHGVVSHLLSLADAADVQAQCRSFFGLTEAPETASECLGKIPADTLDALRRNSQGRPVEELAAEIASYGLGPLRALDLAQALRRETARGSIVRLETKGDEIVSQRGLLLLEGQRSWWLFEISPTETDVLSVYLGTPAVFDQLFMRLLS
ncbi:MAG: hypothetical protein QXS54_02425 [Candidatus Methanomethylicaceae archaeon]